MKISIPFIGFIEKTVRMNIIRQFLDIFRNTQDKHRVLIIIPFTLLVSHSAYMSAEPYVSLVSYRLSRDEIIWLFLNSVPALFMFCYAVFSGPFNPTLYVRQTIFVIWAGLLHRLAYGLETLGTTYFTVVSFIALTSFLPFAFTGMKIDQLFSKVQDDYQSKKSAAFVEVPDTRKTDAA